MTNLGTITALNHGIWNSSDGLKLYKPSAARLAEGKSLLEIGAGRNPIFTPQEMSDHRIDYVANDILQSELDAMLVDVPKYAFDACLGDVPAECIGRFDVIISQMVQEHLKDTRSYYANLAKMLRPGGIAMNLHPVLYAIPFAANRVLPEDLSSRVVSLIRKDRVKERRPKFKAYYDQCVISTRVRENLRAQGFSKVVQFPYFGHGYYKFLPPLHEAQKQFAKVAARTGTTALATFSLTVAVK